jgi:MFS transporter, NNP family, nitrate/nitrite transporter
MPNAPMPNQNRQLFLSTMAFALSFAVWGLLGALAPILKKELALSQTQTALLIAIPVLLGSLGRLVMGVLADRYGGRIVMSLLLLFTIIPTAGIALSSSYGNLLFWAFFLGIAGTTFSVGVAFTSKWFDASKQGTALGIFGAGNIGQSIAVFFAPRLATAFGSWHPVVWIFGLVSLTWGFVFWLFARDAKPGQVKKFSDMIVVLQHSPMAWLLSLFYFVTFGGFVAMGVYLPTLLTTRYGLELSDAGLRTAGFVVIATTMRPIGGWLADKIGGAQILIGVYLTIIACALLLIPSSIVTFTVGALVFAAAVGLGNGAIFKMVPEYFPSETGTVTGLVGAFGGLGGFFPPLEMGLLLDRTGSYTAGFLALAFVALICAASVANLARHQSPKRFTPA